MSTVPKNVGVNLKKEYIDRRIRHLCYQSFNKLPRIYDEQQSKQQQYTFELGYDVTKGTIFFVFITERCK
jgi:hypothetical protein